MQKVISLSLVTLIGLISSSLCLADFLWEKSYVSSHASYPQTHSYQMTLDSQKNIIVTGDSQALPTNGMIGRDLRIVKYAENGTQLLDFLFHKNNEEWRDSKAVAVDSADNIIVSACHESMVKPSIHTGLAKISSKGVLIWAKDAAPELPTYEATAIAVDSQDNSILVVPEWRFSRFV